MPANVRGIIAAEIYNAFCKKPGIVFADAAARGWLNVAISIWEDMPPVMAITFLRQA